MPMHRNSMITRVAALAFFFLLLQLNCCSPQATESITDGGAQTTGNGNGNTGIQAKSTEFKQILNELDSLKKNMEKSEMKMGKLEETVDGTYNKSMSAIGIIIATLGVVLGAAAVIIAVCAAGVWNIAEFYGKQEKKDKTEHSLLENGEQKKNEKGEAGRALFNKTGEAEGIQLETGKA